MEQPDSASQTAERIHTPPVSEAADPSPDLSLHDADWSSDDFAYVKEAIVWPTVATPGEVMKDRERDIRRNERRKADAAASKTALSKQEVEVRKATAALAKQNNKLKIDVFDKMDNALKKSGDLQNFAEAMERDFLVLEETLRLVEGRDAVESASKGSQWKPPK